MKRNVLAIAGIVLVMLSAPAAYSGGPSWMGDAEGTFLYNDKTVGGTAALNNARYSYHLGVWGDYDWVDYLVEVGSASSASDHRVNIINAGVPFVFLNRAKFTVHVVDVLFLDFGRFDNPLALDGWNFMWDNDYKTTGWGQRVEVGNFFMNAVEHLHIAATGNANVAVGSSTGGGATILLGGNLGYTFEFKDGFSLLAAGEAFNVSTITTAGGNFLLSWDKSEGYPIIFGVGGYIPVGGTTTGTTLAGMGKLQYGDLSIDNGYMFALSGAYWGDGSFINRAGATGAGNSVWANERLVRTSGVLFGTGAGGAGGAAASSTVIDFGIDAYYRFHSWFKLGIEADYGTASKTTLTSTSFIHAELVAKTEF